MQNKKGIHYIVNAYGCRRNLDSVEAVKKLLEDLIKKIGMHKLSEPLVLFHDAKEKKNSGVTGIILLSESHISIHTFSERDEFYLDLFSCKPYDVALVKKEIGTVFQIERIEETILRRGLIV